MLWPEESLKCNSDQVTYQMKINYWLPTVVRMESQTWVTNSALCKPPTQHTHTCRHAHTRTRMHTSLLNLISLAPAPSPILGFTSFVLFTDPLLPLSRFFLPLLSLQNITLAVVWRVNGRGVRMEEAGRSMKRMTCCNIVLHVAGTPQRK